eukprot:jgi/Hompol1/3538/HPOL_006595-RA
MCVVDTGKRKRGKRGKGDKKNAASLNAAAAAAAGAAGSGSIIEIFNRQNRAPSKAQKDQPLESSGKELLNSIFEDIDQDVEIQKRTKESGKVSKPAMSARLDPVKAATIKMEHSSSDTMLDHDHYDPFQGSSPALGSPEPIVKTEEATDVQPMSDIDMQHQDQQQDQHEETKEEGQNVQPPVMAEPVVPTVQVRKMQTSAKSSKSSKNAASFLPKFEKEQAATEKISTVVTAADTAGCTDWRSLKDTILVSSSSSQEHVSSGSSQQSILNSDGSLSMFWFDAHEKNGTVYLFGKVFQPSQDKYASCCLIVKNIQRNLFILPRPTQLD